MGTKSDAEILQGLADHRASNVGDAEPEEPTEGVGETIEDDAEEDESDDEDTEDEELDEESGDESEEESEDNEPDDSEEEDEEPDPADEELAKRQAAEKEAKQRINEHFAEKNAEIDAKIAEAEKLNQEAQQAKAEAADLKAGVERSAKQFLSNPIIVARRFGLEKPEDFLKIGRMCFRYGKGRSPGAKPEEQQWADSIEHDGAQAESVNELQTRLSKYEEREEERKKAEEERVSQAEAHAEAEATISAYVNSVVEQASESHPVAASILAEPDEETTNSIVELAYKMSQANGKPPTEVELLDEIEKQERKRLKRLKLNPDELFPRKTKTKDKSGTASKEKKAPVKKKKKRQKTGKSSRTKTDAEILAELKQRRAERAQAAKS